MNMNDLISDMIARIKNGQRARLLEISIIKSHLCIDILNVLYREGYIRGYSVKTTKNMIYVYLKYIDNKPVITEIKRISKPGRRYYINNKQLDDLYNGLGILILTTSKGVISNRLAKEYKLGGELICTVF